jgi:cytochrome c-type biogenesis protein CcmH
MMAAAQEMSAEERQDMISGMVAGLAERLATEGGSAQEWARLINAYGVLGRNEDAQAVLQEAQTVFAGSAEAMALFDDIARRMAR